MIDKFDSIGSLRQGLNILPDEVFELNQNLSILIISYAKIILMKYLRMKKILISKCVGE